MVVSTQMVLPEEFRKSPFAEVSRTFLGILAVSIAVHVGVVVLLLSRPRTPDGERGPAADQARHATLIVRHAEMAREAAVTRKKVSVDVQHPEEQPTGAQPASGRSGTGPTRGVGAQPGEPKEAEPALAAGYSRTRERLAAEVRSLGVLGVLTSGTRPGGQDQAQMLIGGTVPPAELDATLGGIGGLKSTGTSTPGRELRGGRATEAGTIDSMVGELGTPVGSSVQRGGSLVVEPVTPLTKEGEVTTLAGRDPDQVSRVVNGHNDAIEYCYQKELRRNPTLRGRLAVRFTITPEGKVSSVTIVSSTLNSPELENCIVRRIQRWDDFGVVDASLGEATFRQVYTFGF
ncbi:MAG: TonB family protein [candidate division KSB1 bacterium]|nr:TonB family protein [candidate division KSB1 bacterium]